jgi:predicted nucleic-acid-binding Zn-ribbon protein
MSLKMDTQTVSSGKVYEAGMTCMNCKYFGYIDVPFGQPKPIDRRLCPKCGCTTYEAM